MNNDPYLIQFLPQTEKGESISIDLELFKRVLLSYSENPIVLFLNLFNVRCLLDSFDIFLFPIAHFFKLSSLQFFKPKTFLKVMLIECMIRKLRFWYLTDIYGFFNYHFTLSYLWKSVIRTKLLQNLILFLFCNRYLRIINIFIGFFLVKFIFRLPFTIFVNIHQSVNSIAILSIGMEL